MTNKEIAQAFDLLARVMELHNENPFKIKSYQNAYLNLRKLDQSLSTYTIEELMQIKGIGEAIAEKIQSLVLTGAMPTLEKYKAKTPPGVVEMLKINGLGPKKVAIIWKELGIESPGELLYACNENRLVELKGFGEKTQSSIIQAIGFLHSTGGKYLHTSVNHQAERIMQLLTEINPQAIHSITGSLRLGHSIVEQLDILTTCTRYDLDKITVTQGMEWTRSTDEAYLGLWNEFLVVKINLTDPEHWADQLIQTTGPQSYLNKNKRLVIQTSQSEEGIYRQAQLPYVAPELREIIQIEDWSQPKLDQLIRRQQINGIIHSHSTYSDGIHSLEDMANATKLAGFEYLAITDHSQAAAYARGLKPEKLFIQWAEIDALNQKNIPFRILKGIECDILASGQLDYEEVILKQFELVIASIHSAFQMDIEKATSRIIKAIESPFTNIVGHPTGRLLLTRAGYPLHMTKIIDACKANQVALELNANPQRLDLDYGFIQDCMDQGVYIAINPDAHNMSSIHDIDYGVLAARKGKLTSEFCLNTMGVDELLKFCHKKK